MRTVHQGFERSGIARRVGALRLIAGTLIGLTTAGAAIANEPISPIPLVSPADPAKAALGKRLFADPRLSSSGKLSCASCHPLARGGADGVQHEVLGRVPGLARDTPTIFNTGLNNLLSWDGAGQSLEALTEAVLLSPARLGSDWKTMLDTIGADAGYRERFAALYPAGPRKESVIDALVNYQRSLLTPNARFDKFLKGEAGAITPAEKRGYALFKSLGCASCHQGINVGGNLYQRFGIFSSPGPRPGTPEDLGRLWLTRNERDRGVFRVPSLRNIALTAPYFHDGREPSLDGAVRVMSRVQLNRTLSDEEASLIVQFLRTLTGELDGHPLGGDGSGR
jgi:cytochrome c peroxidase